VSALGRQEEILGAEEQAEGEVSWEDGHSEGKGPLQLHPGSLWGGRGAMG
jgi:hypothetical protein